MRRASACGKERAETIWIRRHLSFGIGSLLGRHPLSQIVANSGISHPVNPFSKQHGAPSDSERHVGDLGNFETDAQGNAKGSMTDEHIKLFGQESVLGVRLLLTSLNE